MTNQPSLPHNFNDSLNTLVQSYTPLNNAVERIKVLEQSELVWANLTLRSIDLALELINQLTVSEIPEHAQHLQIKRYRRMFLSLSNDLDKALQPFATRWSSAPVLHLDSASDTQKENLRRYAQRSQDQRRLYDKTAWSDAPLPYSE